MLQDLWETVLKDYAFAMAVTFCLVMGLAMVIRLVKNFLGIRD